MELQAFSQMLVRKLAGANPAAEQAADQVGAKVAEAATGLGKDELSLSSRAAAKPATMQPFKYEGMQFPDLSEARDWQPGSQLMSGTEANKVVTQSYHQLDQVFSSYLGTPDVANWLTFGKYASNEAGAQISNLEDVLSIGHLSPDTLKNLAGDFFDPTLMKQGLSTMKVEGKYYEGQLGKQGKLGDFGAQLGFVPFMQEQFDKLHHSLVIGNTQVYHDVTPAYDIFLKAESAGQDGVAALKKAGYGNCAADPQGLILKAFTLYQEANRVGKQADAPYISAAARQSLLAKRKDLIEQGNLTMVTNEQMVVLQGKDVFGDADISRMTGAVGGSVEIHDAMGAHTLLPNGGNWTDFPTRMGYQEVPMGSNPDALKVIDHQNVAHDYVLAPANERPGTISKYFEDNLQEATSRKMIDTNPADINMRS